MNRPEKIWMNGELVSWADATVHVSAHALHYGTGVFEGMRCYSTPDGPAVFRHFDHIRRLFNSAAVLYMDIPYDFDSWRAAAHAVITQNGLEECYIRPIAFYADGELGVGIRDNPIQCAILAWPWGAYLGEKSQNEGVTVTISSWRRVGPNTIPHVAKATGIYLNSVLATTEARRAGYDEAIMLNDDGYVADGPAENIFVVRDGVITTPPLSMSILPGINRDSVIQLATSRGFKVQTEALIRTDLYLADEIFFTGTGAEVTPVRAIDDHDIGVGEVTKELQQAFFDAVHGRDDQWRHWLDHVETDVTEPVSQKA